MYQKSKLKNGLTLITAPLKETKAVTILVLLPVGSRHENKNINGVAHFIEHLVFKGTKKRPTSLDITKELDAIGAEYNAFTAKDQTGFYVKAAAKHLALAFDILSDLIFNSVFNQADIDKERGVIIEEINMYEDNPLLFLPAVFEQTVFGDNSLGRLISGTKEVIRHISRNKILSYKNQHYQAANLVLSVAGSFAKKEVKALALKYFGQSSPTKKKSKFIRLKIKQNKPNIVLKFKDTSQVQFGLGFPAYSLTNPKIYPLYLLAVILGGNMSSRLFTIIREHHALAYYVKTDLSNYQDTGAILIQAGLDKTKINQAIKLILTELNKIKKEGVTVKELKSAKEFLQGKLILELEDSESVADWFGRQQLLLNKIYTPKERLAKIFKVKNEDIKKVANELFVQDKLNLALIGPFKNQKDFLKLLKF